MLILEPAAMRAWEEREIQAGRADPAVLMRHVASAVADFLDQHPSAPRRLLVLVGKGHNGNDGLLIAALLRHCGWEAHCLLSHPPDQRKDAYGIPEVAEEIRRAAVFPQKPAANWSQAWTILEALTGSGVQGPPRGALAEILHWLKALPLAPASQKVSLDMPAGLGQESTAFRADLTFALGAVPPSALLDVHRPWIGRIVPVPLPLQNPPQPDHFITPQVAATWLPRLPVDAHKRRRGEVAVWAGSPGMAGAAILASRAALRGGAGLVRLWTHPELVPVLATATPEIMVHPLKSDHALPELLLQAPVILAGPGCGRDTHAATLLRRLAEETRAALVLDADALFLAAQDPSIFQHAAHRPIIATPHAGEWSRLLTQPYPERAESARELAQRFPKVIWVLKGPNTIVADGQTITWNATGNPGMATAGMGDVLSGLTAALLARGLPPAAAARLAVCWHGLAADQAVRHIPDAVLTASDVINFLPEAWKVMERAAIAPPDTAYYP